MSASYIAICKMEFVALTGAPDEEVVPGNIGALRFGLEAILKEDFSDFVRSQELWTMAKQELRDQSNDESGPSAEGSVMLEDEFDMGCLGQDAFWPQWRGGIYYSGG